MSVVWAARLVGLVPIGWLTFQWAVGRKASAGWWVLAVAFAVSFIADVVALWWPALDRWWLTYTFPVSQTGLFALVLLESPWEAMTVLMGMIAAALLAVAVEGVHNPDWILYSAECLAVVAMALQRRFPIRLRAALIGTFTAGAVVWAAHVPFVHVLQRNPKDATALGYALLTWYAFQGTRLVGAVAWCWAESATPRIPMLRLV